MLASEKRHWETTKVVRVGEDKNHYHIHGEGNGFSIDKIYGRKPEVGDTVELGMIRGSMIVALRINGETVYDKDDFDIRLDDAKRKLEYELGMIKQFEKGREKLDQDYAALPDVFKRRIDKYRTNNPKFRWEFESYEMCCCNEAVKFADALKTPEEVQNFAKLDPAEQKKVVDFDEGHSGNSFAVACQLAYWFLKEPENVVKMHGALAALVGSDVYGDTPVKEK